MSDEKGSATKKGRKGDKLRSRNVWESSLATGMRRRQARQYSRVGNKISHWRAGGYRGMVQTDLLM